MKKELGEFLRVERQRKQLDLAAITAQTCISKTMLEALEQGDTDKIGTPLLVRSFTRAYCDVLGIDPAPVLEQFTDEIPRHEMLDEGIRKYRERVSSMRGRTRLRNAILLLTAAAAVGIYVTNVWLPSREQSQSRLTQQFPADLQSQSENALRSDHQEMVEQDRKAMSDEVGRAVPDPTSDHLARSVEKPLPPAAGLEQSRPESSSGTGFAAQPLGQQGHRLRVEAVQETWVEARLDDKKMESILLRPGEIREWGVEKSVRLVVGNAGGIKLSWDGNVFKNLGRSGQKVRLRLPEDLLRKPTPIPEGSSRRPTPVTE